MTPPWRLGKCPEPALAPQWLYFFLEQRRNTGGRGRDSLAMGI